MTWLHVIPFVAASTRIMDAVIVAADVVITYGAWRAMPSRPRKPRTNQGDQP